MGLLLSVFLPLAASTVSMAPLTGAPLSKTSATDNAIVSSLNSTWHKTGLPATGSPFIAVSTDRDPRLLSRFSVLPQRLPPPSIDLEASSAALPDSSGCQHGAVSDCSRNSRSQQRLEEDIVDRQDSESSTELTTSRSTDPGSRGHKIKKKKLLKKWALPLLIGYKLKFLVLVPLLFATLALLVASTGFAGFFFAMFTAAIALPKHGGYGR